ncbi:MAG: riboflavin synthase [Desulfobacterales bacterium]|nr:riboflavin synthase [Desulfobacterales bacterium]
MFTGIIEGIGSITAIKPAGQGMRLGIKSDFTLDRTALGDSIAVNGACLTVVTLEAKHFEVDVSPETLARTTFGRAKIGSRVNLERALRLSDRLDGHLVSGHIDGTGTIRSRKVQGNAVIFTVQAPGSILDYMIPKGSVALDGISLTVNICRQDSFEVSIIPHTSRVTTIQEKKNGDPVNIETDMLGKYVARFISRKPEGKEGTGPPKASIDMQLLARSGFL